MNRMEWQRPSEVHTDDGHAVEIADTEEGVVLRYSENDTECVVIPRWAWADFVAAIEGGEFREILPSAREVFELVDAGK